MKKDFHYGSICGMILIVLLLGTHGVASHPALPRMPVNGREQSISVSSVGSDTGREAIADDLLEFQNLRIMAEEVPHSEPGITGPVQRILVITCRLFHFDTVLQDWVFLEEFDTPHLFNYLKDPIQPGERYGIEFYNTAVTTDLYLEILEFWVEEDGSINIEFSPNSVIESAAHGTVVLTTLFDRIDASILPASSKTVQFYRTYEDCNPEIPSCVIETASLESPVLKTTDGRPGDPKGEILYMRIFAPNFLEYQAYGNDMPVDLYSDVTYREESPKYVSSSLGTINLGSGLCGGAVISGLDKHVFTAFEMNGGTAVVAQSYTTQETLTDFDPVSYNQDDYTPLINDQVIMEQVGDLVTKRRISLSTPSFGFWRNIWRGCLSNRVISHSRTTSDVHITYAPGKAYAGFGGDVVLGEKQDILMASFALTPHNPAVGELATFDGLSSFDPFGTITAYNWDFGDGSTAMGGVVSHLFTDKGLYTVTLTVTDDHGFSSSTNLNLSVLPAWTLMFYLDGDNNLDDTYPPILNQLEKAADNPDVQVVALWDSSGLGDSAYYKVQYDIDLKKLATYTKETKIPMKELNMGAPQTLVEFVNWARTNYPAEHYALILTDHGSGLGGGMLDDNSNTKDGPCMDSVNHQRPVDCLTVSEISQALSAIVLPGTPKMDVLFMDACLMAMIEDAYQVRDFVDYYVASENVSWADNAPYFQYVAGITAEMTVPEVAALFALSYANAVDTNKEPFTISVADNSKLDFLVAATNSLAQVLNSQMHTYAPTLKTILSDVQRFEMNDDHKITTADTYIDLYDFARLVKSHISENNIQSFAQQVMDAVTGYISTEYHQSGYYRGLQPSLYWNLDHSHGVSIFFPDQASSFYNAGNYEFATGAIWHDSGYLSLMDDQTAVDWGPMLVGYFQETQPGGPDDPIPPQPLPLQQELFQLYLPVIDRK